MPTTVSYNSQKLIPAPLISISKNYVYTGAGDDIGTTYNITVNGTIIADMGSPSTSGIWNQTGYPPDEIPNPDGRLGSILRKQERLRQLFADNYKSFEVQSADGSTPLKCNPKVNNISFQEDTWYTLCRYTVELEANSLTVFGSQSEDLYVIGSGLIYLNSADENWSLEFNQDVNTFSLTHSISAQGKNNFDQSTNTFTSGIDSAKAWVKSKLGIDMSIPNSNIWGNTYDITDAYDYLRGEQVDNIGGSYSVTENWTLSNKPYTEQYTVEYTNSQDGIPQVSINGEVTGLSIRTANVSGLYLTQPKFVSCSGGFYGTVQPSLYSRALNLSRVTWLNPTPLSYTIGSNEKIGNITYNYTYDLRPVNVISGARFENITITDNYATDVVAIIPVLGRRAGPIIQDISTVSEKRRTVNIEVAMYVSGQFDKLAQINNRPYYSGIILAVKPTQTCYAQENSETWDINSLRGSRTVSWVYT